MRGSVGASSRAREIVRRLRVLAARAGDQAQPVPTVGGLRRAQQGPVRLLAGGGLPRAAAPRRASARHADHCRTAAGRRRYRPAKRNSAPVAALRRSCSASAQARRAAACSRPRPPSAAPAPAPVAAAESVATPTRRCWSCTPTGPRPPSMPPAPPTAACPSCFRYRPPSHPPCATDRAIPPRSPRHPSRSTGPAAGSRSSPPSS